MKAVLNKQGVSLLELVVTITILSVLASGIMPLARNAALRTKEIELRRNLRIIRIAIDDYKKAFNKTAGPLNTGNGYPASLQVLVDGHDFGDPKLGKKKFLRRKVLNPLDPNSAADENWGWGLRSYEDEPTSRMWGGKDVFDVYAPQEGTALDSTQYKDW